MDRVEHLGVKDAAVFEGVEYETYRKGLQRKHIVLTRDREDGRRKLVPLTAPSPNALAAWVRSQVCGGLQGTGQETPGRAIAPAAKPLQPAFAFAPPSPSETARVAVVATIPKCQRVYVDLWLEEPSN